MSDTKEINSLSSAIVEGVSTILKANTSTGTLTVEAKIKEIVDEGIGIYKVQYLDNTFNATAINKSIVYDIDESVYILVPNGDFDKEKIIIAPAEGIKTTYADISNSNFYIPLGDNILNQLNNDYELSLCSYKTVSPTRFKDENNRNIDFNGLFEDLNIALLTSRVFSFTCEILTDIPTDQRRRGNYGIILTIPTLVNGVENELNVTLDINNFSGDPYDYEVYAKQITYFTIPEDNILDESRDITLKYFVKDFIGQDNTKPDDIFIKNFQIISTFEATADNMAGYHLMILSDNGNTFYGNYETESKKITANLYLDGKLTNLNNYECYWFKENVAVNNTHEKYSSIGGVGWEILNDKINVAVINGGVETFQYVTNVYEYTIHGIDILADTIFKCVLIKKGQTIENKITIKVINSNVKLELFSNRIDNIFIQNVGNAIITMRYSDSRADMEDKTIFYIWQRFDQNGNLVADGNLEDRMIPTLVGKDEENRNIFEGSISIPLVDIEEKATIKCGVLNAFVKDYITYEKMIGTKVITISTTEKADYSIYVENGDKLFKYDADGNSPMMADYDGAISSKITSIAPISIRLFKPDGDEFSESEYAVTVVEWLIPINSMIVFNQSWKTDDTTNPGYWTIKGSYNSFNSFPYSIANVYDYSKTDNIILIHAYLKDTKVDNVARLRFLKDGEGGTNGSKYTAIITYNGYAYGEKDSDGVERKFQLYKIGNNFSWYRYDSKTKTFSRISTISGFNVDLYVDGEKIEDSTIEKEFSIFDENEQYTNTINILSTYIDRITGNSTIVISGKYNNGGNYSVDTYSTGSWKDTNQGYSPVLVAKVRAQKTNKDSSISNSEEYVYAYYPIEMIYIDKEACLFDYNPSITEGFDKILYAPDGTNPKYNSNSLFKLKNDGESGIEDFYDYSWKVSSQLGLQGVQVENQDAKVIPKTKYDTGQGRNFIKVDINKKENADELLEDKIEEVEQELQNLTSELSYYIELQSNLQVLNQFNYDNALNVFTANTDALLIKSELLKTINFMEDKLNSIKELALTEQESLSNLIEELNIKIEKVIYLEHIAIQLCYNANILDIVKAETPENYILTTEIVGVKGSINSLLKEYIDEYNSYVNITYSNYLNQLNTSDFYTKSRQIANYITNTLIPILYDPRWTALGVNNYINN